MKSYFIHLVTFGTVFTAWPDAILAQSTDTKITSVFLYNFTKYVKWPSGASNGDFVIGVYGESPVIAELQRSTIGRKAENRRIVIRKISSLGNSPEITSCQILFVSQKESRVIKDLVAMVKEAPVLLVSEGVGMARKGSTINIYVDDEDNQVRFELNKGLLERHGLKASSELLTLAELIR